MPSLPALTIYAFGFSALLVGSMHLVYPTKAIASLNLPETCIPASNGNSLAAIAMGIYYILAAAQENRKFFYLTIPMRFLTSFVFWKQGGGDDGAGWRIASSWEGGAALVTAGALFIG